MRILIDLQSCQTAESKNRGIGKYSRSLTEAMLRQTNGHEFWVALNGSLPTTIEEIGAWLSDLIAPERVRIWRGPRRTSSASPANAPRRVVAEVLREAFIDELRPDAVFVTSVFEGLIDDAITGLAPGDAGALRAATLYDLIPLANAAEYLRNVDTAHWYFRQLQSLKRADLLCAISEHSRQEAIDRLALPPERIVSISGAVGDAFRPSSTSRDALEGVSRRHGLTRPFVMYTGGFDRRKNVDGLVRAYARLHGSLRGRLQLAIICAIKDNERRAMGRLTRNLGLRDDEVVFVGYVPEADLAALYCACELFVFPSLHEGFGLPVLEAMSCGAPTIAANNSSIPEVVGASEALFDATNPTAIVEKMTRVLTDGAFRQHLRRHALVQSAKFSWSQSAGRALEALEHAASERRRTRVFSTRSPSTAPLKLAFVSPLPPLESGIACYSADLLRELARYYEIEVVTDQIEIDDLWIEANFPRLTLDTFAAQYRRFDRVLYQIGNSEFHVGMPDSVRSCPGVVALHDYYLSGLKFCIDQRVRGAYFRRNLLECEGYAALATWADKGQVRAMAEFPMNADVLREALGVVVHSPDLQARLQAEMGFEVGTDVHCIPALRSVAPDARSASRKFLNIAPDTVLTCAFGHAAASKLSAELVKAFSLSQLGQRTNARLVFVGSLSGEYATLLDERLTASGVGDRVTVTGFASAAVYQAYLGAADIAVQLRAGSRGETSRAVLDCLAHGLPTIVNVHGTMTELDDAAVVKIADPLDVAELSQTIDRIWADPDRRARLSRHAREVIASDHTPARIGEAYREAIERSYALSRQSRWLGHIHRAADAVRKAELSTGGVIAVARNMVASRARLGAKRIFLDVTELVGEPGDGSFARDALAALLRMPTPGWRIEPARVDQEGGWAGFRFAQQFGASLVGAPTLGMFDEVCEPRPGDVLVGLASQAGLTTDQSQKVRAAWRDDGVAVYESVDALIAVGDGGPASCALSAWINLNSALSGDYAGRTGEGPRATEQKLAPTPSDSPLSAQGVP